MRNRALLIGAIVLAVMVVSRLVFPGPAPHVSMKAEQVLHLAGFPIENTAVAAWASSALILFLFWRAVKRTALVPAGRSVQNVVEIAVEGFLNLCLGVAGARNGRRFFPLIITIFVFVFISNYLGLLPGYHTIGWLEPSDHGAVWQEGHIGGLRVAVLPFKAEVVKAHGTSHASTEPQAIGNLAPFLRSANTSLNTTIAMALVAMAFVEFWGLRDLGFGYLGKFINLRRIVKGDIVYGLIDLFVGVLDIISELARLVSLSFRLFGNIFAGEVLLSVMTFLVSWALIVLFLGLELLVGAIQALVFALLTLVFATIAVTAHGGETHESQAM